VLVHLSPTHKSVRGFVTGSFPQSKLHARVWKSAGSISVGLGLVLPFAEVLERIRDRRAGDRDRTL